MANQSMYLDEKRLEEAAKRDHRRLGVEQELFFFSELSPGSAFFLPHGTKVYARLIEMMRSEYHKRGYQEVTTPNIYKSGLWETSGHWGRYKDNMFVLAGDEDDEPQGLKPMNCPGHCIVFGHRARSFRELPIRMAEFGVLHRNEDSGALTGLSRVRKFVQDDAHLFCTQAQVKDEVMGCLDLMKTVYGLFHFEFALELSTRPAKYMGELEVWDRAERELAEALDAYAGPGKWKTNAGDGAFYGPKIDIHVRDAIGRSWQTATVQLDFQLPISFNLRYLSEKGEMERPVIVHRAILGSIERFMGILIEHVAGLWPLWLSPRQVAVLTVVEADELVSYAHEVGARFTAAGFDVDVDVGGDTIKRKIRNAVVRHYNYIFVVGKSEVKNRTINVRSGRSNEVLGEKSIDDMIADLKARVDRHE